MDDVTTKHCAKCGEPFEVTRRATSAIKCPPCRRVRPGKKPATAACQDCGVEMTLARLGRPRLRCDECLSVKERRARVTRPSSGRESIPCHQCQKLIYDTGVLHGAWTYCPDCGPGPGVMRRLGCAQCGSRFWYSHKGGKTLETRKWLCGPCGVAVRWCPCCDEVLPVGEFARARDKRDGRMAHCRRCLAKKYRDQSEDRRLLGTIRKFNISVEQYRDMELRQGTACAICRTVKADSPRGYLMVDHDHACCPDDRSCGACVRGLLCMHCNFAIGLLRDDRRLLIAAIEYLDENQGVTTPESA